MSSLNCITMTVEVRLYLILGALKDCPEHLLVISQLVCGVHVIVRASRYMNKLCQRGYAVTTRHHWFHGYYMHPFFNLHLPPLSSSHPLLSRSFLSVLSFSSSCLVNEQCPQLSVFLRLMFRGKLSRLHVNYSIHEVRDSQLQQIVAY